MYLLPERSITTLDHIHHMDALSLLRALADKSVDAIITDMPYGTTDCAWDTVIDLVQWWQQVRRVLKPRGVFVTTAAQPFTSALVMSNTAWFRHEWIWNKHKATNHANVFKSPLRLHESILVFGQSGVNYYPQLKRGDAYRGTMRRESAGVWNGLGNLRNHNSGVRYPKSILDFTFVFNPMHPTQKPVPLYEYLIKTYTRPGELVLDPFSGSGTTAIVARKTGRHFICGDSSAEYVAMSRHRLATTDPYQDKQVTPELKQRTLFPAAAAL